MTMVLSGEMEMAEWWSPFLLVNNSSVCTSQDVLEKNLGLSNDATHGY